MLFGFIGRISSANQLKENLDLSAQRTRGIAQRVAGATLQNQGGFAMPNGDVVSQPEAVNLEGEMTSLADEQLRFRARRQTELRQRAGERNEAAFVDHVSF